MAGTCGAESECGRGACLRLGGPPSTITSMVRCCLLSKERWDSAPCGIPGVPSQPLLCVKCGAGFRGLGACDQRKGHSTLCRETQGQTVWASGLSPFLVFGGIGGCLGDSQRACADCSRRRDAEMLRGFFAPNSTRNACCLWLLEVPSQAWCCSRVCWAGQGCGLSVLQMESVWFHSWR